MPRSLYRFGTSIYRPGVITYHNLEGLVNLDLGVENAVLVIGEATAGEPQASSATSVVHSFTDPQDMIDYFIGGNLAEVARCLFDPVMSGQTTPEGITLGGCQTVYAIKTNQSTQASYTLQDGSSNNAVTIKDKLWGAKGNQTWFKVETSGTGINLTVGRDVSPNIGSQTSIDFSITSTDEWLSVTTTGNFTGVTCTYDYNVANAGKVTLDSSVALEDLQVTVAGKTLTEVAEEINAFNPHGTGSVYLATVLRADRADTLASYLDNLAATSCFNPAIVKNFGVAYDIVEWVNANCFYCEATWVAGYEPTTYTKTYLAGGALGATSNISYVQDALKVATRFSPRFVSSAFNTSVNGGAITLSTINAEFATHATNCNALGSACERQVFICNDDTTKAAMYTTIGALNNEYLAVVNNTIYREDETGTKEWLGPHCVAAAAAATMAGSPVATPLTHRYIKADSIAMVATDFDPVDDTDFMNGIRYGLLFLEVVPGTGVRFAKGISTYRLQDNDARIYLEVVEARIRHKVILRRALDIPEIGQKGRGIFTVRAIERRILEAHRQMADVNDPNFILVSGTDVDGNEIPPYRNIRVSLAGDTVTVTGELTFTEQIAWIVNDFRATLPTATVGG